ncbi:MAG: acetolactate synthase small subunit [Chthonomonas sp.]|nr:acetolactate synthase small subunit [Chthonomonas sp.]
MKNHTITALVQDEAGTLNRLVSLFRRRGYNLASLNVGVSEQTGFSRLTVVVQGDDQEMNLCVSQLRKLIDVVEANELPTEHGIHRELALIKVNALAHQRSEVLEVVHIVGGRVAHLGQDGMTIEFADEPKQIEHFISLLEPYGVQEIVRTGLVAMRTSGATTR